MSRLNGFRVVQVDGDMAAAVRGRMLADISADVVCMDNSTTPLGRWRSIQDTSQASASRFPIWHVLLASVPMPFLPSALLVVSWLLWTFVRATKGHSGTVAVQAVWAMLTELVGRRIGRLSNAETCTELFGVIGLSRHRSLRGTLMLSAATALAGCTTTSNMRLAPQVPEPAAGAVTALPPYRIQIGDVLEVRLLLNPELNEEVTVRPDGHISTTIVPDERAYGRTVPDLNAVLRQEYGRDLRNPRISVIVKSFAPTRIYVGGEVTNPGELINVGPTLTLSQAIARAGGPKISGDEGSVFIIRRGPNDAPEFLRTEYASVIHGHNPLADVRLAPYDVVYVPKTGIAEVYKFFNQYVQQFVPVSWGFSYLVNSSGSTSVVNAP
jgi:polysaccharide export outer membrane protein